MERLQKILARAGIASRRAAEQIILAGRVRVDGRVVRELGTQVDERKSRVEVDGTKIVAEKLVYIVLHKPRGVVCTLSDPEGRPTIRELLKDAGARVVPVGRLDFHTSGALLCTNDGEFAQALAHPKREVPKVYVAKVKGTVEDDALESFGESIEIDGRSTRPAQVKRLRFEGDKTWLEITLREGRNRQVRRLGEAKGFPVMRLARISHAGVTSEDLRPGQWRPLSVEELVDLKKEFGVPKKVRAPQLALVESAKRENKNPRPQHGGRTRKPVRGRTQERGFEPAPEIQGTRFSRTRGSFETETDRESRFSNQRPQRGGEPRSQFSSRKKPFADDRSQRGGETRPSRKGSFADERSQPTGAARASSRKGSFGGKGHPPARAGQASGRRGSFGDQRPQPAGGARVASRKGPFAGDRPQPAFSSRKKPLQSERQNDLNRPWKTRSRSAIETGPEKNRRGRAPASPQDASDARRPGRSSRK